MSASVAARNAANAQHSTGPVTAEGKARSAQNALRHGLTSRTVVLAHENHEAYDTLKQSFLATYRPQPGLEQELVIRMLDCWWRLTRALRVETEFLAQRADAITEASPELTGDAALAAMFSDPGQSKSYRLFLRYLTNAQNAYRDACAEFRRVRKERLARQREEGLMEAWFGAADVSNAQPTASSTPGFVSHTTAAPPPSAPESLTERRPAA